MVSGYCFCQLGTVNAPELLNRQKNGSDLVVRDRGAETNLRSPQWHAPRIPKTRPPSFFSRLRPRPLAVKLSRTSCATPGMSTEKAWKTG